MIKPDKQNLEILIPKEKIPIRISFMKSNGFPTVVSLWYTHENGRIYCAVQKTAKVISYIQKNPKCGFEIAGDMPPYKGLRGEGTVKTLHDKGEEILETLIEKYLGTKESMLSRFLRGNSKNEVAIEVIPQKTYSYDYSKRMKDVIVA
ncbi:hypothetical protein [Nitrosopumilus sp.]|uniref:hypothetical protein n=1 Tax=Nitrosopumilus sp. TaxID=2024843 RepID=UPI003B5AA370